jgi:hypothetical protein
MKLSYNAALKEWANGNVTGAAIMLHQLQQLMPDDPVWTWVFPALRNEMTLS